MQTSKEFQPLVKVPLLDSSNYGYWKVKVMNLIRGLDEDAWRAVEEGWDFPKVIGDDGTEVIKPGSQWTLTEKKASALNAKALTIIFNTVDSDEFKQIQGCKTAKEAWNTLELIHEGTKNVKRTRRDMLKAQFNQLRMEEYETVKEFSGKLSAMANEAWALGTAYSDKKLVKKLLASLPIRFLSQKTSFQTFYDTDTVSFKETVGVFATHELELSMYETSSGTSRKQPVAFHVPESEPRNKLEEDMSLIVKKMNKFFKRRPSTVQRTEGKSSGKCMECKGYGHWKDECPSIIKREAMIKTLKEVQCYECKGFGHTKNECITSVKGKSLINHEDSESESEDDEEALNNYVAFIGIIDENDVMMTEDLEADLKIDEVYDDLMKMYDINMKLVKEKNRLESELKETQKKLEQQIEETTNAKCQLEETKKNLHMLGNGTKKLDFILSQGRQSSNHTGLGYTGEASKTDRKFVSGEQLSDELQQCPKLAEELLSLSLQVRHMTENHEILSNFVQNAKGGSVTFGDGKKGKILSKGTLNVSGLPKLKDVKVVQGLRANLISISQLCDDGMKGEKTPNNCYTWMDENIKEHQCFKATDAARGLSELSQHVKQVRAQGIRTSQILEQIRSIQIGNISRKRYVHVCIDDFSQFSPRNV
ncbi:PREDICTED: uncharacterized protein LOC104820444 [Tarenaya hassleriana]|uniref:uncharacterized protein LOC104820444 n=1 Tax=Tarenaya hassleriana TaxID=28532 RepID=UPI00053C9F6F|nr:PREDICTED: uncharacterized protein LOC104820444 [Tarenaya hassleriana]